MRMKTTGRMPLPPHADGSCSVWCRVTRPLFRWLFLGPDGNPPFRLVKAPISLPWSDGWWVPVDERGWLLEDPSMHVHDEETWRRMEKRHYAIFFIILPFMGFLAVAYLNLMDNIKFIPRHDLKLFYIIFLFAFIALFLPLVTITQAALDGLRGKYRNAGVSPLKRFSIKKVLPSYRSREGVKPLLGMLLLPAVLAVIYLYISGYPQTLIIRVHLWAAAGLIAASLGLLMLVLLLNALFWPCLECHGLREEDFLFPVEE